MELKVKLLNEKAVMPEYAHLGDAGMDLTVTDREINITKVTYKFGIAVEIPVGYVGLLFPRSSVHKYSHSLSNSVGVIDAGYRGEIKAVFYVNINHDPFLYEIGERALQLIIVKIPFVKITQVEELSNSERGEGGYGSTGK